MKMLRIVFVSCLALFVAGCATGKLEQKRQVSSDGRTLGCTRDLNPWGVPSSCECHSSAEIYNPKSGFCVASFSTTGVCTRDLNQWGFSGQCSCPERFVYNEVIGQCVLANEAGPQAGE